MKFLKFFFAIIALGCAIELSAYTMGRTAALIPVAVLSMLILAICAILYSRACARSQLLANAMDTPIDLSIKPYNAPILLKKNENSSGRGSGSSVTPMNRVSTNTQNAPKTAMKSSMR